MPSLLNPYLSFRNTAREAMEFYRTVFGGKVEVMTFGAMAHDPSDKDLVMHSTLTAPNGFVLMGSDRPAEMPFTPGNTMAVSLSGDDDAELRGYWNKLVEGGSISQPLVKAPWGDSFGMVTDRFGTSWLVNIAGPKP